MIPRAPRLFGRDRDLAIVREAIDLGSAAIVGAPGVGKTELALHLAATSERQVVWVDVSSAWDGDEARAAIARELGIPLRTRDPAEGRAAIARSAAARGDLLFVLDGAETCLEEVCALSQLVRTLVVSRAPVEGAHSVEPLAAGAALELFLDRASLDPSRDERALAQRIVGLLGGYPAAIELAAPCSLRRLADTLDLDLDPGDPAVVQATIAWAIARLSPESRAALSKAAVFERPFSFGAFERVSPGTPFDVLTLLADAGLVRVSSRRAAMERMVRASALRDLDDEGFRHVLGLHASLMGDLALAALRAFEGEAPPRLPETADLQAAHATALVDPDLPKEKVGALALALVLPDPSRASIFDLDRLDATIGIAGATPFGGRVRGARAALARSLGRPTEAAQGFSALRELARSAGDRLLEARALLGLGDLALDAGAIDEALRHDEEALARGALDAPHLLAHVLPSLARGRRARGDLEDAVMLLERAIVAESHGGAPHARALLHVELARVRLDQGKPDE
ncbi:MAG: AAA family ATPase, partial [Polyangiales bacterium]